MNNTKKIWTSEVMMMYPKQWIVMIDLENEHSEQGGYRTMGFVHYVTNDEVEARKILRTIRSSEGMDKAMLVEGWDDKPQVGGLSAWSQ